MKITLCVSLMIALKLKPWSHSLEKGEAVVPTFARRQISVIIVWENTICYAMEKYVLQNK